MLILEIKQLVDFRNDHSVLMVYSRTQTNDSCFILELPFSIYGLFWVSNKCLSQELSFTVNGLFRVSNKCFLSRIIIKCVWVINGLKQMLHLKNYQSMLIVYSGSQNASSQELSVYAYCLFSVLTKVSAQELSVSVIGVFKV